MTIYLRQGKFRCQVYRNKKIVADRTFPIGTSKKDVREWESKVKLGLISPQMVKSRNKGKIQFLAMDPADVSNPDPTFEEFLPIYFSLHAAVEVLESTADTKRQILAKHWIPRFGGKRLSEIKAKDIRQAQAEMWANGHGLRIQTIRNILAVVSQVFMAAVVQDKMEYNPCSSVKRVKDLKRKRKGPPGFWSFEERNKFLSHALDHDHRIFELVAFAVSTGLRPGELRGLQREQLDFENYFVNVDRAWCQRKKRLNNWTKGKIDRKVSVPPQIMRRLERKRMLPAKSFVFSEEINFSTLLESIFKPMCRRANVPIIKLHDLRHTFASHCVLKDLHQVEIRDLLGHIKLSSTDVYMHLRDDDKAGVTDCLMEDLKWLDSNHPKVVDISLRR